MASKADIVAAINAKVKTYNLWRIGLTHDLAERKQYWRDTERKDTTYWSQWTADSLANAQDIESRFIKLGMQGGTGGDLLARRTVYLYVF